VRRLQRDYLPSGVATCEEAEMLIQLDGVIDRADKAWTGWLVATVVEFAAPGEQPTDAGGTGRRERLRDFLASGPSTKAVRRIKREINRRAERPAEPVRQELSQREPVQPAIPFPLKGDNPAASLVRLDDVPALPLLPIGFSGSMNRLDLAA
jgi:hypothetical protein